MNLSKAELLPLIQKVSKELKTLGKKPSQEKLEQVRSWLLHFQDDLTQVVESLGESLNKFEQLSKFSSLLNSTLDTAVVREKALEATCELLGCETASLFLVDAEKKELYFETALGDAGEDLKKTIRLPINEKSIAGYVAKTGDRFLSNDLTHDPRHFKAADQRTQGKFKTKNMLCIPLKSKKRTVGVLQALNKGRGFSESDLDLLESLGHQVTIAIENSRLYAKLKKNFYDTVQAMVEAIEKKDSYTGGHTKRVVIYSVSIARHLHLSPEDMDRVRLAAILHDVGKIGIEDKILKKAAPLDHYEWPVMRTHPQIGFDILKRVEGLKDVIEGAHFHHERWDGKGYPSGLKGEAIPLVARIVAVADTYDAMVSTRPYRRGLDPKIAYQEIVKNSGSQFCPKIVDAFKKAFHQDSMGKKGIKTGLMVSESTEVSEY